MNEMIPVVTAVLNLLREVLSEQKTDAQFARELIDQAFATGVPASMLSEYLTDKAAQNADVTADIAEEAKMFVKGET